MNVTIHYDQKIDAIVKAYGFALEFHKGLSPDAAKNTSTLVREMLATIIVDSLKDSGVALKVVTPNA